MAIINIFISSKFDELQKERKKVKDKISSDTRKVFLFEIDAGAKTEDARKVYRDEVENSDIYVGIFNEKYSYPTHEEYKIANLNKKDILIYASSFGANREPDLVDLLSEIKKAHTIEKYNDEEDLVAKVGRDIENLIINSYRRNKNLSKSNFSDLEKNNIFVITNNTTFSTNSDCWKEGYFSEGDVELGSDVRRPIVNAIKSRIQENNGCIIFGKSYSGKTMILYKILAEEKNQGNTVLYIRNVSIDSTYLKKCLLQLDLDNEKTLLILDDCHNIRSEEIFKLYNDFASTNSKIRFLFASRYEEFESYKQNVDYKKRLDIERAIRKLSQVYLEFTKDEAYLFVDKIIDYYNLDFPKNEVKTFANNLYKEARGDLFIFILLLMYSTSRRKLEIKNSYLVILQNHMMDIWNRLEDKEYDFTLLCALLNHYSMPIDNSILNRMGHPILKTESLLRKGILFKNFELKMRHELWVTEFINFLFNNVCKGDVYSFNQLFNFENQLNSLLKISSFDEVKRIMYSCHFTRIDKQIISSMISIMEEHHFETFTSHERADLTCFGLGSFYLLNRKFEKALDYFNRALELERGHEALNNKGFILTIKKDYAGALRCFDEKLVFDPNDLTALNNKSNILNQLGRYNESLLASSHGLDLNPNNPGLWENRGKSFYHLDKLDDSLACYRNALQFEQNKSSLWYSCGLILSRKNKLQESLTSFDKAISIDPNYADAWCDKGLVLENFNPDEALKCYNNAIKINPKHLNAIFNKGSLMLHVFKNYQESISLFRDTIEIAPKDSFNYVMLGQSLMKINNYDEAKEVFDRALHLDPQNNIPWYNKGLIHYSCNEYLKAIECFDKVIANPQIKELFKSALENNGSLTKQLGQYQKSIDYYKRILAFEPTNFEVLYMVGIVMLLSNDILTGIELIRSALRINPKLVIDAILNDPDIKLLKNWKNLQNIFLNS